MEVRMARIETMMEALIHERGMTMTPMGSIEREGSGSDGFRSEAAFALPLLDPINPALAHMEQQSDMSYESPEWSHPYSQRTDHASSADTPLTIRLDSRTLPFPRPIEYQKYMNLFFGDIHLRHSCIEEGDFRSRGERILAGGTVQSHDVFYLALNYVIFACCDILTETAVDVTDSKPLGWNWFQIADDLVDKNALLGGPGNLVLTQLLLFQALYLTFADVPDAAYTTIGLASRLVFQYGLHQQRSLSHLDPEQLYAHICVFWNVFITDRCISLSCGRPYSIREKDINVDSPRDGYNKVLLYHQPRTDADLRQYANLCLSYSVLLAHRAGYVWDNIVVAESPNSRADGDRIAMIDSQIDQFITNELPAMYMSQSQGLLSNTPNKVAMLLSNFNTTLLLRHRAMTSLQYDGQCAREFSWLALDAMEHIRTCTTTELENLLPKHTSLRHHITSSIAGALLVFCALLVRDLSSPDLDLHHSLDAYLKGFQDAVAMLDSLKRQLVYAYRVVEDFKPLVNAVGPIVQEWSTYTRDQQIQRGFDLVKFLVPPNIAELFPYRALTPSLQANPSVGETFSAGHVSGAAWGNVEPNVSRGTVLWL